MNFFENIPPKLSDEEFTTLLQEPGLKIERIVSRGQASEPGFWYEQKDHEWVMLISGEAEIELADGTFHQLNSGDHLKLPAGCKHRVNSTSSEPPALWLAVHYS